jgi:glucose/mannose-6-phosphate isomerase
LQTSRSRDLTHQPYKVDEFLNIRSIINIGGMMEFIEELRSLKEQFKFERTFEVPEGITNVVIAGMGGSGIVGKLFTELYSSLPVVTVDSYTPPDFVGKDTLFIAISYSGNTEETVTALQAVERTRARTVSISTGGRLSELAQENVLIPKGLQPRAALGYMLTPLIKSFNAASKQDLFETNYVLENIDKENGEQQKMAEEIFANASIPVIYGIPPYKAVAYRWQTQFGENAKILAYSNFFPELNHNDTMALEGTYRKDEFYFIAFTDNKNPLVERRIGITEQLTDVKFRKVKADGHSALSRMMSLVHKGDYVTYYLALLRQKDPTNVHIIEDLKQKLKENPV